MKAEFSNNYERIKNQFPKLPNECRSVLKTALRRDALRTIRNFKDGIKTDSLGLVRLKEGTIKRKKSLHYEQPTYPLYGAGDEYKRTSYMNMLRINEDPDGYTVHASQEKHWSGALPLNVLWDVHEHGRTIKRGNAVIVIPPRPALTKAFNRAMRQRQIKKTTDIIKTAIVLYLVSAQKSHLEKAKKYFMKGLKAYDIHD